MVWCLKRCSVGSHTSLHCHFQRESHEADEVVLFRPHPSPSFHHMHGLEYGEESTGGVCAESDQAELHEPGKLRDAEYKRFHCLRD